MLAKLNKRYFLVKALSRSILGISATSVKMSHFKNSCFRLSFTTIDNGINCNKKDISVLHKKIFQSNGEVTNNFKETIRKMSNLVLGNLTLTENCLTSKKDELT